MNDNRTGVLSALAAFVLWGVLPVFWKQLGFLPAADIVAHRTVWSLACLIAIAVLRRETNPLKTALASRGLILWLLVSGTLLAANWILYVWATINGHIIEAALGYYLTPFLNMLFGALFYGERNSRMQNAAIGIALTGVALQIPAVERFPWIAVSLALTFSLYALCKKQTPMESRSALTLETALLVPFALLWLAFTGDATQPSFGGSPQRAALIIGTGLATTLPLLCFGHAARNIRLTTLGILQFTAPTLQFLLGWLVYQEHMDSRRLLSFALIWTAVALYAWQTAKRRSTNTTAPGASETSSHR